MTQLAQKLQTMSNKDFIRLLREMGACSESIAWCEKHGGTPREMWKDCTRGDWLGWFFRHQAHELGITLEDWASALADGMSRDMTPNVENLVKCLRKFARGQMTHGEVMLAGYSLGLTADFSFPMRRWPNIDVQAMKNRFPVFPSYD